MRLRDNLLILGVAAGLVLAATLVVTSSETRETLVQPAHEEHQPAPRAVEAIDMSVADTPSDARTRETPESTNDDIELVDASRRREARKREAEFLAEFLKLRTEQGPEAFERALREVLASSSEPLSRKDAALRALHSAGVPGADAQLANAVQTQADVSDGASLSVPRYALKLLFERAPSGEDARRVLARLAFVEDTRISSDLRKRASTALKASLKGTQHDEVVRLLRLETTPEQFESAIQALSRDPNFGAEKPTVSAYGAAPEKK